MQWHKNMAIPQQSANSKTPHAHTVQAHTPTTSVPVYTGSARIAKVQIMGQPTEAVLTASNTNNK